MIAVLSLQKDDSYIQHVLENGNVQKLNRLREYHQKEKPK